jgi:glycosyltransferase involved in cell wall biosynthesis/peptidoglycan/xylan/chitin deacetylase (PgdA/CDA1 family)
MKSLLVTTSWDDGHKLDVRLSALLKKYGIAGTFYVAPKDHEFAQADLLTDDQTKALAETFEIGAHTMTHPSLSDITDDTAREEIEDSKHYLEKLIGRPITAFCYPRGEYRAKHVAMVKNAGFIYARTVRRGAFDLGTPLEAHTTINTYNHYSDLWKIVRFAKFNPAKIVQYFQWDNLAKAMFDRALETGGEYHLWGHSWEIEKHGDWDKLESVLAYISRKQNVKYVTNSELATLRPKKLLIAIPYFPPYHGGTQIYSYNIGKRLHENLDWEVCVATSGRRGFFHVDEEMLDGLKVYRLSYWFKISNTPINPLWPFMLRRIIKTENVSIINAHAPVPFMSDVTAMVAGKKPLILTYHTGSMEKTNEGSKLANVAIWLYEHGLLHWLLKRANFIVCPSDFVRFDFLKKYRYKSMTITPAVDANFFKPGNEKTEHPTILFVAGLTRSEQHKGLKVLLNAFKVSREEFPDLRLVIVGEGNMRPKYEAYVKKLNIEQSVTFTGKLNINELAKAYHRCDMFILPSLAPAESFGMVLIEAMASGKPVIGSRAGGIPLVIDDEENGLIIPSNDVPALVAAIKRLLDNPDFAKKLSEAGRKKTLTHYNWEIKAAQYDELFKDTLEKKPSVAQVVAYYPPHIGGMEVVAQEISIELARRKYPVTVFTSTFGSHNSNDNTSYYRVERLEGPEFAHTPILWSLPFRLLSLPRNSIVHVHISQAGFPEMAWLAAKLKNLRLVMHFHLDVGPSGTLGFVLPLYKKMFLGPVLRSSQKVIVFSDEQAELVHQKYGVREKNIAVIPNGIRKEFFSTKQRLNPHNSLRLLYVGRLNTQKRVDRIIEAVSLLKIPVQLTIVGEGELRPELEALVQKLGLQNVYFTGKKFSDELQKEYLKADVFLTSSDQEGMSLVALEALASGLPIVGSNVIGTKELINGVGILVDEPYPKTFADVITKLWEDPNELRALSEKSSEKAKQYSWEKLIGQLEKAYKEILP